MSAYRFCRTDDIGLLVDAVNRCWAPYFPGEPLMTPAGFKRSIRDLQVWCSSCMVAFSGADPIGVLIGAKRPAATLVHRIAVHPEHRRQGHGRHMLASLGSKLAILGPPRMVAEVPEGLGPAGELFRAAGYVEEGLLTDHVLHQGEVDGGMPRELRGLFIIPVTVDDLAANGLFTQPHQYAWERSTETLTARKAAIEGLAVASGEQIEACILYIRGGTESEKIAEVDPASNAPVELVWLRSFVPDGGSRLAHLLSRLGTGTFRYAKAHPAEISSDVIESLGFRPADRYRLYAGSARGE